MAERRMFAKTVIDSDAFTDMPLSTQALYFHLSMRADDDGFLNSAQKIMRMIGAAKNDFDLLIAKRFIIQFPDGICVIKHWRIHNYLRKDRYVETVYTEHKAALSIKENGAYSVQISGENAVGIPDGNQRLTQVRIDKDRLGKDSIVKDSVESAPAARHIKGQHGYVKLTDEEYSHLLKDLGQAELDRVIAYIDESAAATGNKNKWKDWNLVLRKASREKWGVRNDRKQNDIPPRAAQTNNPFKRMLAEESHEST